MSVVTDSFFQQGFKHEVCEDYATHGPDYAIICDGCSNAGGPNIDTDFGSRIIAKAAEEHVSKPIDELINGVCGTAKTQIRMFPNLPLCSLTSTLMIARKQAEKKEVFVIGDGIVAGRKKDGTWRIHSIEFAPGGIRNASAPFYLKYLMFNELEFYKKEFGGICKVETFQGDLNQDALELPIEIPRWQDRESLYQSKMKYSVEEFEITKKCCYSWFDFQDEDYDLVVALSDGAHAVSAPVKTDTQKFNQGLYFMDVMRPLLDIIRFKKGFLRNHRNWLFKQNKKGTIRHSGWITGDDISAGGIYTGE